MTASSMAIEAPGQAPTGWAASPIQHRAFARLNRNGIQHVVRRAGDARPGGSQDLPDPHLSTNAARSTSMVIERRSGALGAAT